MSGRNRRGKGPIARGLKSLPEGIWRLTPGVFVSDEVPLRSASCRPGQAGGPACGGCWAGLATGLSDGIPAWPGSARGLGTGPVQARPGAFPGPGRRRFRLAPAAVGRAGGGGLFPVLDADITLIPAATHSATLTLTGAYRPPPGTAGAELDRVIVYPVAKATVRAFLHRVARAITHPARAAGSVAQAADLDPARLPPEPDTP